MSQPNDPNGALNIKLEIQTLRVLTFFTKIITTYTNSKSSVSH